MVAIKCVQNKSDLKRFIDFPYQLYSEHPLWIPPLKKERRDFFDKTKNPYFEDATAEYFMAINDSGDVIGRISAQNNRRHNERYDEKTGHFGNFDCINDSKVAQALFQTAENWMRNQGLNQITGPFSFSTNEESGLLVKGFDDSPYPLTPYNFEYYDELVQSCGFETIKDLWAWKYSATTSVPEPAQQIADVVREYPGLTIRELDMKNIERDIKIVADIFNSAWSKNWGFLPWTEKEIQKMATELKLILDPRIALIAEVDGKPAAIGIAFPNYYEAIKDLNGNLFPFGFIKFLSRVKKKSFKTGRLALLGIKKEYRKDILGGLSVLLYSELHSRGQKAGYVGGELSWTLEDNERINNGIQLMGGEHYKTFRVYGKAL